MTIVAALELPARFNAADQQLALVDDALKQVPAGALVLLNEQGLCGYVSPTGDFDLSPFAEPLEGPTAHALQRLAQQYQLTLVGPLVERSGEALFNSMIGFAPDGTHWLHYRKHHPWYPETWATAATEPWPIARLGSHSFTAAICFDVHFLPTEAAIALDTADVLLFASAWVDDGPDARTPQLQQLARTHRTAIINANWGIGTPHLPGQGNSMILDAQGSSIGERKGALVLATLPNTVV